MSRLADIIESLVKGETKVSKRYGNLRKPQKTSNKNVKFCTCKETDQKGAGPLNMPPPPTTFFCKEITKSVALENAPLDFC